MPKHIDTPTRRRFLKTAAAAAGAVTAGPVLRNAMADPSARTAPAFHPRMDARLRVGIMGTGGRGTSLAKSFAALPMSEVVYVCDVDSRRASEARTAVAEAQESAPSAVTDFRRVLDDGDVDALVIAAPNHWHAPAAILAMSAGKHVYVEKPGSHNAHEGELLVEAAAKHRRLVQMGNQRRSWPRIVEGIERVRSGEIGTVHYSRGWYANTRKSIGRGREQPAPEWLDYELWQGPAPREPYRNNILHYNWHWFWNWGGGELANNGIHALDLCRWGLDVGYASSVRSSGGRYFFDDDQQTPDTHVVTFEYEGGASICWEGLSCNRRGIDGQGFGASFHGADGSVVIDGLGYRLYDAAGVLMQEMQGDEGFNIDQGHLANFRDAILDGESLHSPIAEGQKSTLLCHLGNIAQRTGRILRCDQKTGRIRGDDEAQGFWERSYAPGWEPRV